MLGGEYCFLEWNAFLVLSAKDMGNGRWSEEKRRHAVNSKGKLLNKSWLVVFFPGVLTG